MSLEDTPQFDGFRDHRLSSDQLPTALAHLYRAQVGRADAWRARLDSSTNWAVVTTAAGITVAFSEPNVSHLMIPLLSLLVSLFWGLEARRYRYFELWSSRVRHLERAYFAELLSPSLQRDDTWANSLAESLRVPEFHVSLAEALGRRYRRVYVWVHSVLAFTWLVNIWIHPTPVSTVQEVLNRPILGLWPSWIFLVLGILFHGGLLIFAFSTRGLKLSEGEVL